MATRARKAAPSTPAKKTTTKKATARAPRKRTAKKTTPALTLVQPAKDTDTATQVDTRDRLTVRRRLFVGPMGPNEQAAIRAALASAALRLPVPVRTWNGSTANLTDGTILIHNPSPDRVFTAHIACRRGSIHGYPITSADDLKTARAVTHACERRHADNTPADDGAELNWHKALGHGIQPTSRLGDGLQTARKTVADTQPLSTDEIAAHIAQQIADQDAAKEHPQP
jgi:hypothetical protein